jgi:hypothetical protein
MHSLPIKCEVAHESSLQGLASRLGAGSPWSRAAEHALTSKLRTTPELDAEAIAAWADKLWPEPGKGTVDPLTALQVLNAFSDRPRRSFQPPGTNPALAASTLMLYRKDDQVHWTSFIDTRDVQPLVEAFLADVKWLASLDLSRREDREAFGAWCGWRPNQGPQFYDAPGTFAKDSTYQYWLQSTVANRHGLPDALREDLIRAFSRDSCAADSARWPASTTARILENTCGSSCRSAWGSRSRSRSASSMI